MSLNSVTAQYSEWAVGYAAVQPEAFFMVVINQLGVLILAGKFRWLKKRL